MGDTPKLADECKKLLDNGWMIQLSRNELGSYLAVAVSAEYSKMIQDVLDNSELEMEVYDVDKAKAMLKRERVETDDFEPSQALYRLTEKVFGRIA